MNCHFDKNKFKFMRAETIRQVGNSAAPNCFPRCRAVRRTDNLTRTSLDISVDIQVKGHREGYPWMSETFDHLHGNP